MTENWRAIEGYEGIYEVSDLGRVRNVKTGRILRPGNDKDGYMLVVLCFSGKPKSFRLHRLVAQAFIPNPLDLPQINHKDENKTNNYADNLEWCDAAYNVNYGTRTGRCYKPVLQFTRSGVFLDRFASMREAARQTGIDGRRISDAARGRCKTSGGYIWRYESDFEVANVDLDNKTA